MAQPCNVPDIPLHRLGYRFTTPRLLIGGMAMEYYGLRVSGADIDFVATRADYAGLAALHPDQMKDLHGDLGVCVGPFEVWTSICRFDYDALAIGALDCGALDCGAWRVIALEKLLLLKCLCMEQPKNVADVRLIAQRILDIQYGKVSGAV